MTGNINKNNKYDPSHKSTITIVDKSQHTGVMVAAAFSDELHPTVSRTFKCFVCKRTPILLRYDTTLSDGRQAIAQFYPTPPPGG